MCVWIPWRTVSLKVDERWERGYVRAFVWERCRPRISMHPLVGLAHTVAEAAAVVAGYYGASREANFFPPCCNNPRDPTHHHARVGHVAKTTSTESPPPPPPSVLRAIGVHEIFILLCFSLYIHTNTPRRHRCQDSISWFAAYRRAALTSCFAFMITPSVFITFLLYASPNDVIMKMTHCLIYCLVCVTRVFLHQIIFRNIFVRKKFILNYLYNTLHYFW